MKQLRLMLSDRRRRQRGSILSGLLIIVAFLSILAGALLTELTDSFVVSRELADRFRTEATGTSAVELAINRLQNDVQAGTVPAVCVRDARGPWFPTSSLNGRPAAVTQTCSGIVPELPTSLQAGSATVDGVHATTSGQDRYLVSDSAGLLTGYTFGQNARSWVVPIGGAPTATLLPKAGFLLIPTAMTGNGCGGHCVALFNDGGGTPSYLCSMFASTTVTAQPAIETSSGLLNFSNYAFFGGSGAAANLYVYDASATGNCGPQPLATRGLGGGVAGAPLVFRGTTSKINQVMTINDEIFVLVSDGSNTSLQHWTYSESSSCDSDCDIRTGPVTPNLNRISSLSLTNYVGGSAAGYAISSTLPTSGSTLTLAIAGTSGRMATVQIAVSSGPSYSMSGVVANTTLAGGVSRPPYWCHCPGGQNVIGVGSTNGVLYLLNTGLAVQWSYDGSPDGSPAINTTPAADVNGEWYFGADDGNVYDVEIPTGIPQMFKAAKFGPGGAIAGSPIVGTCPNGQCVYFASSTAGSYFARIGSTRMSDLRACVTSSPGSTTCAANPRLWVRVQVGSSAVWPGSGVYVQGWSFYSP